MRRSRPFVLEPDDSPDPSELPTSDAFGRSMVADLSGSPQTVARYKRGGQRRFQFINKPDAEAASPASQRRERILARVLTLLDDYRSRGVSEPRLRTIRALMLEWRGLRRHARDEQVSAAAICSRIYGGKGESSLEKLAPEFISFWRQLNANRRDDSD